MWIIFKLYCIHFIACVHDHWQAYTLQIIMDIVLIDHYYAYFFLFIVGYKKKFMLKIFVLFKILHHFIARIKAKTVFNVHEERNNTIQYRSKRLIESVIVLVCLGHKFSTIKIEQCFLKHKWKIHCIKCPPLKFCLWNYNNINKLHFGGAGVKLSFLYQEYRRKRKVRKW